MGLVANSNVTVAKEGPTRSDFVRPGESLESKDLEAAGFRALSSAELDRLKRLGVAVDESDYDGPPPPGDEPDEPPLDPTLPITDPLSARSPRDDAPAPPEHDIREDEDLVQSYDNMNLGELKVAAADLDVSRADGDTDKSPTKQDYVDALNARDNG